VSVLFCDLVGFTARSEMSDPEDVRARLRPYHRRVREEIERYGGTVEKFVGDAVMAVFGVPKAHEDDAERAVRAGLRILEAIEDMNATEAALELQVRIGINTGEAVVALGARPERGEGLVTGDVVNTAARIQSVAPVDAIAVGEPTYRTTALVFEYEQLEPVQLKGKRAPVPMWRARAARSRFGVDVTRSHTTPFVARELEQRLLHGIYERSLRDASVQLVTIVGEPGVGKTRLVSELGGFVDERPELVSWRQGRCLPYGEGVTFWALGEVVKAEAGILESDSPEQAAHKLDVAIPSEEPDREWLKARLAPLVGVDAGAAADRDEAFTAWRRFLESIAAEGRPAILVFEDLHWADAALLAFLEHLVDWAEGVPLLVVCTARPELYERHGGWAGGKRNATTINLAPLTDAETAELVTALLGVAVLPAELQALVLDRAGGNPLYAEELVRSMRDQDLIVRTGRTLRAREGARLAFPDSLQALIAARLDTLSPERKALLQDAAVIGRVFWAGAVAALGARDVAAVKDGLHELSRKELVRPARLSSIEGESEYAFWHLLVCDVAYAQIPRASRAVRHRAAADWIERTAGGRVEDVADLVAHHYITAFELALAAGDKASQDDLQGRARHWLTLAGDRALALDVARAEASYARALELAPPGHPERPRILAQWANAAHHAGRPAEAAAALEEAIGAFRQRGDALATGQALTALSTMRWDTGDSDADWAALTDALAVLERVPPGADLVETLAVAAGSRFVQGALEEAAALAERSLALARELGLEEPARALGFRGGARCIRGDVGGLSDIRRALELSIERGRGRDAAVLHNNFAETVWPIEGPEAARGAFRRGLEFCERRGLTGMGHTMQLTDASLLIQLGKWEEALARARSLETWAEESGAVFSLVHARSMKAYLLSYRGDTEGGVAQSEWLIDATRMSRDTQLIASALPSIALALLERGYPQRAASLIEETQGTTHARDTLSYIVLLPDMVRTALVTGATGLAERVVAGVEPLTQMHEHSLYTARAALTEARRELEKAAGLYSESAGRWERFGALPERGHALMGHGRCLLELGWAGAEASLREARDIFAGLRALRLLNQVDELLARSIAASS
jgi:class 3 adenylate cyclase/tetratricopeptide (TPR) repeat protein